MAMFWKRENHLWKREKNQKFSPCLKQGWQVWGQLQLSGYSNRLIFFLHHFSFSSFFFFFELFFFSYWGQLTLSGYSNRLIFFFSYSFFPLFSLSPLCLLFFFSSSTFFFFSFFFFFFLLLFQAFLFQLLRAATAISGISNLFFSMQWWKIKLLFYPNRR